MIYDLECPRNWGIGTMYCSHSRYNLGDESIPQDKDKARAELLKIIQKTVGRKDLYRKIIAGSLSNVKIDTFGDECFVKVLHNGDWHQYLDNFWKGHYNKDALKVVFELANVDDLANLLKTPNPNADFVLPLYLTDHSSRSITTYRTSRFDCSFVGWYVVTRQEAREVLNTKKLSQADSAKIYELMNNDISEYSDYLS